MNDLAVLIRLHDFARARERECELHAQTARKLAPEKVCCWDARAAEARTLRERLDNIIGTQLNAADLDPVHCLHYRLHPERLDSRHTVCLECGALIALTWAINAREREALAALDDKLLRGSP